MGPLQGIKVVDMTTVLMGPYATQMLGDYGADVIKVESPDGDVTRQIGPTRHPGMGPVFLNTNRSKRSVCLDLKKPAGREAVLRLIAKADVLVYNVRPQAMARLQLDYDVVAKVNPRLIYAGVFGFGQDGPRASQPGYDFLIQGMSGIMDLTGDPSGEPQKVGVAWIDIFTGLYGTIAVQAALAERARSGRGQHLDLSLLDCGTAVLANQATNYLLGGTVPHRLGNAHPNIVPYQLFPTADGHAIIACGNDRQFAALCRVLGLDGLAQDPDYATNPARVANRAALVPLLAQATGRLTRAALIAALDAAGVPVGPVNDVAEGLADPQIAARGLRIAPEGIAGLRTPILFSRSTLDTARAAPALGAGDWRWG